MKPTDLAAEVNEQIGRRLHDVGVDCPCDFVDIIQSAIEKDREQNREWAESITKLCNEPWLKKLLKFRAAHASENEIWKQANIVCALSGAVAHDCDHYGLKHPAWWRAVKKLQKLINQRPTPAVGEQ